MASHLGVNPADHVVLEWTNTQDPIGAWRRILPDATAEFPFEPPAGRYLVITDLDWLFQAVENPTRQNVTFRLFIAPLDDLANGHRVHESTALLDDSGYGGASESMTSGVVVDETATLIWDSAPPSHTVTHVLLRGYLIDRP
jgi:hypothetical protein